MGPTAGSSGASSGKIAAPALTWEGENSAGLKRPCAFLASVQTTGTLKAEKRPRGGNMPRTPAWQAAEGQRWNIRQENTRTPKLKPQGAHTHD